MVSASTTLSIFIVVSVSTGCSKRNTNYFPPNVNGTRYMRLHTRLTLVKVMLRNKSQAYFFPSLPVTVFRRWANTAPYFHSTTSTWKRRGAKSETGSTMGWSTQQRTIKATRWAILSRHRSSASQQAMPPSRNVFLCRRNRLPKRNSPSLPSGRCSKHSERLITGPSS